MLETNKNAFNELYTSRSEHIDKQSVMRAMYKKLVLKGKYDFESKRSGQVLNRFAVNFL